MIPFYAYIVNANTEWLSGNEAKQNEFSTEGLTIFS